MTYSLDSVLAVGKCVRRQGLFVTGGHGRTDGRTDNRILGLGYVTLLQIIYVPILHFIYVKI